MGMPNSVEISNDSVQKSHGRNMFTQVSKYHTTEICLSNNSKYHAAEMGVRNSAQIFPSRNMFT